MSDDEDNRPEDQPDDQSDDQPEEKQPKGKKKKVDNPSGFEDDFYKQLGDEFKRFTQNFNGNFPIPNDAFMKMFKDIMKQMNIDPAKMAKMTPEQIKEAMQKGNIKFGGPSVFGFNMNFGPDGKPNIDSFGNVKPRTDGESEVKAERDPLVDIYEEEGQIVVVAEVPGVKKEDIELKATANELEITADSEENSPTTRKYHKLIPLPVEINPDVAKARYQNGILEVKLIKVGEKSNRKKINID